MTGKNKCMVLHPSFCEYLSRCQTMSYMYRYIIVHALVHICVFVRVRFTCKSLFFSSGAGSSGMGIAGGGFVRIDPPALRNGLLMFPIAALLEQVRNFPQTRVQLLHSP